MDRSFLGFGAEKAREIKCGVLGLAGDRPLWGLVGSSALSEILSGGVPAVAGRRTKAAGAGRWRSGFRCFFVRLAMPVDHYPNGHRRRKVSCRDRDLAVENRKDPWYNVSCSARTRKIGAEKRHTAGAAGYFGVNRPGEAQNVRRGSTNMRRPVFGGLSIWQGLCMAGARRARFG